MDILLVLGSVTAQQYAPVRFAMLNRGLKPRVVRVPTKYASNFDFGEAASLEALKNDNISEDQFSDYVDNRVVELKELVIGESFGNKSVDQVKAIIREPLGIDESYEEKMLWLTEELSINLPDYTVMVGDDGSSWLQGAGYGDLQIS
jgi:hypothetical protein